LPMRKRKRCGNLFIRGRKHAEKSSYETYNVANIDRRTPITSNVRRARISFSNHFADAAYLIHKNGKGFDRCMERCQIYAVFINRFELLRSRWTVAARYWCIVHRK
jgi:hypothetical protein